MKNPFLLLLFLLLLLLSVQSYSQSDSVQRAEGFATLGVKDFEAKLIDRNVQLVWTVLANQDARSFEVEKEEGGGYRKIGSKLSLGLSGTETYEFVDALPRPGAGLVYRIKIIGKDGSSLYSDVRTVATQGKAFQCKLKQNPVRHTVDLEINAAVAGTVQATVLTAYGQRLLSETIKLSAGRNSVSLSSQGLASGLHRLVLESGAERTLLSFVKE